MRLLAWLFGSAPTPAPPARYRRLCPACGTNHSARSYFCPACHQAKLKLKESRV